jgi:putative acetyltransferase
MTPGFKDWAARTFGDPHSLSRHGATRIEIDDVTRSEVLALLEEHLRSMHELSPPDQVFAFDASKLRDPGVTFWTAWKDETPGVRARGYRALFLETGRHPAFGPAQALYRSVGFRECGPFGSYTENGNSVFMSLQLSESSA